MTYATEYFPHCSATGSVVYYWGTDVTGSFWIVPGTIDVTE